MEFDELPVREIRLFLQLEPLEGRPVRLRRAARRPRPSATRFNVVRSSKVVPTWLGVAGVNMAGT